MQQFINLYFLKSQYTPSESSGHIPPKEKFSGVVQTDTKEEKLLSSQHCFKGPRREKAQILYHVSKAEIPPTENNNLKDHVREKRDPEPQTSHRDFKGPRHGKEISSHLNVADIRPREKILRDDQTEPQDGNLRSSQHNSTGHVHEKDQISSFEATKDIRSSQNKKLRDDQVNIPPKEKKTSNDDQTDPQHGIFGGSQHSSKGHGHEKEQIPSHVNTTDMRHRKKKNLRDVQKDPKQETLQTSQHNFKEPRHEKLHISSHISTKDNPPREEKISRAGQKATKDGGIDTSKLGCSGNEIRCSEKVPTKRSSDDLLQFSDNSISSHIKHLSLGNHEFAFHARKNDHLPEERNDTWHIQIDSVPEELVISEVGRSEKEHTLGAKLPRRNEGTGNEESSTDPKLPHLTRLCREKEQFKTHASSNNVTPRKRKGFCDIQTDTPDGGGETSRHNAATKKRKTNIEVPTITCDPGLDFSVDSTSPRLTCLSFKKGNFLSHATNQDISPKEEKTLKPDLTDSVHGGPESSQFGGSGKNCTAGEEVPERTGDVCLEFSNSSAMTKRKHFRLQKHQMKTHEGRGDITPQKYRNSRFHQTVIREENVESAILSKFNGVPADTMDTDTSGPLPPNEQQTTLSIDSGTTNQATRCKYETDVGSAPPEIQRPILKVSEDGYKACDDGISLFYSLIPHIQGLSPARKLLLQMKTLELIYNFVYKEAL
ncbi:hypothetical protein B7P43_G18284 [Cryptotermes secundus]|uniref:BESS domain-containing protein n=1 Tax=Cryptotermes secundus TaxID=105785 RepID=A0A2J7RKD9_9NEOP|nr:hypothetical protein B7P43_G18284 [Cryptotermes secundus]